MEKTFILGNDPSFELDFGVSLHKFNPSLNEKNLHDWVLDIFSKNEIEKIIIEIGEYPLISLMAGYHIRLSIENLKWKSLIPILFTSRLTLNSILIKTGLFSQIIATKGVFFTDLDLNSLKSEINHLYGLNDFEYLSDFLKVIQIQPDEKIGRHSVANIWGAHALDFASNINSLPDDFEFKKSLYFKYISAFNNLELLKWNETNARVNKLSKEEKTTIDCKGKRILLIDDEADNGWEIVLKKLFVTSSSDDFVVIKEKIKNYEAFSPESKKIIETQNFDLYLVDLRLNGLEEEENLRPENFSGMKILRKIKSINQGNQVIIFTASNKVWNLKSLLDAGADGYYLKESPEYNFSTFLSKQNLNEFLTSVNKCFQRKDLRKIYVQFELTRKSKKNSSDFFLTESGIQLEIAWKLFYQLDQFFNYGFLTVFQIIESYASMKFIEKEGDYFFENTLVIQKIKNKEKEYKYFLKYVEDYVNGSYFIPEKESSSYKPTQLFKISCLLYFQLKKDEIFLKNFGTLNKIRNDIAHGKKKDIVSTQSIIDILEILQWIRNLSQFFK